MIHWFGGSKIRIDFHMLQKWPDNTLVFLQLVLPWNEFLVALDSRLVIIRKDSTLESICWIKYNL